MPDKKANNRPWGWIPTLYLAEGIPYVVVMTVAVILYKRLELSNSDIALYTSWLYLPWVIKPLWSPLVDLFGAKRQWIIGMQFLIGAALAGVALSLPGGDFLRYSLAFFWLLAFSSATHDIAADGFYMIGLNTRQQACFIGIRTTFYRLAVILGQGGIVLLAGMLELRLSIAHAWAVTFGVVAGLFLLLALYHLCMLPKRETVTGSHPQPPGWRAFFAVFVSFFRKKQILPALAFMLLFRFAESQLVKLAAPFLLDGRDAGGLGLGTAEVGFIYGTAGVIALTAGGILGGILVARNGLKQWIWVMTLALNLPNLLYVLLAFLQPENTALITACVVLEQFGYGFGFTAYTFFLILFSAGEHKTAHYALCTGVMAAGMMLPGMFSGWMQEQVGYFHFFLWVAVCTIPSFLAVRFICIPQPNTP